MILPKLEGLKVTETSSVSPAFITPLLGETIKSPLSEAIFEIFKTAKPALVIEKERSFSTPTNTSLNSSSSSEITISETCPDTLNTVATLAIGVNGSLLFTKIAVSKMPFAKVVPSNVTFISDVSPGATVPEDGSSTR